MTEHANFVDEANWISGDVEAALMEQASDRYGEHREYYQGEGISKEELLHGVLRNEFNYACLSEKTEKK